MTTYVFVHHTHYTRSLKFSKVHPYWLLFFTIVHDRCWNVKTQWHSHCIFTKPHCIFTILKSCILMVLTNAHFFMSLRNHTSLTHLNPLPPCCMPWTLTYTQFTHNNKIVHTFSHSSYWKIFHGSWMSNMHVSQVGVFGSVRWRECIALRLVYIGNFQSS